MTNTQERPERFELTFDHAFGDGDTNNGVALFHPFLPQVRITETHANFLPNINLDRPLLGADKDGEWSGRAIILTDNFRTAITNFTLIVSFANKRVESFSFLDKGCGYDGFYLEGKFDKNNFQSITGGTDFGNYNDTGDLKHVDSTLARLTCKIGERGAVGYFISTGNNIPYVGGFVARPPE